MSASVGVVRDPLPIGPLQVWPPVILAPMAGVTNPPFRQLCRDFGAGLYVSEMITARGLVEGGEKSERMATFAPGESPRSLQLYGTDPEALGRAASMLTDADRVDHIDLNFGCPAPKVTRHGGGAAVPARRRLFRRLVRAAVQSAGHVPVTVKFRVGIDEDLVTYLDAGRIAEDEGASAVALHARTAEQLYSGRADWSAIARLKEHVRSIPVLGNGDIWEANDAVAMMHETGCDGVVIGRGCLGRPWLFRDLVEVFEGRAALAPPSLGEVADVMLDHARRHVAWFGQAGIRDMRKHTAWYLKGYRVGSETRARFATVTSLDEMGTLASTLDRDATLPRSAVRLPRGHTSGPRAVALPPGWLDHDDAEPPGPASEVLVSGG